MVTLTIILAEISLVLLIVVLVIAFKAVIRRRRDQAAVNTLVTSIKENQAGRVDKLVGMLKEDSQLNHDDALDIANTLIKKQNKFYQEAIELYYTRNHEILSKLDHRLEDLLSQYQTAFGGAGGAITADNAAVEQLSKDIAALSKELEQLRGENANLSSQLKAAEQELDQLGREYVSAFNKPKVAALKDSEYNEAAAESVAPPAVDMPEAAPDEEGALPQDEQGTETDVPVLEDTVSQDGDQTPVASSESPVSAKPDDVPSGDDGDDDQLLAGLNLEDLIGEQPGQTANTATAAKK